MAYLKCKMCGGSLEVVENTTIVECEYCGSVQTLPKLDDEKKLALFDRANYYRTNNEFDKASIVYENIINEEPNEAEAHWGVCLCRYGIEYVEDPKTKKRVATCHRTQFKSIFDDADYLAAIENADILAREIYQTEAHYIDSVQKGILEISSKEEPFDVFICYKETDDEGERTVDSVIAQEIYNELVGNGYKVFFARITLEDKLGSAYEPYIFSALNSSKIMLVVGTKTENFNAVWVKNEWRRYLSLIENGDKKTLIPCYRNITAYELPDEFVALQAQDVSKVGWMQDLLRGITKIHPLQNKIDTSANYVSDSTNPLLERANMYLEDGNWQEATNYFNRVLDMNPSIALAYVGLLLAQHRVKTLPELESCTEALDKSNHYEKALRFGDDNLKNELQKYNQIITVRNEENHLSQLYDKATSTMKDAMSEIDFNNAADLFKQLGEYRDSSELAKKCTEEWNERITKAKKSLDILSESMSVNTSAASYKSQQEKIKKEELDLRSLLSDTVSYITERDNLRNKEVEIKNNLEALFKKKSSVGLLAVRQKKVIEQDIEESQNLLRKTSRRITEITDILKNNPTREQLEKKLADIIEQNAETEKHIQEQMNKQKEADSLLDEAKKIFLTYKYFFIISKEAKTIRLLSDNKELLKELLSTSSIIAHRDIVSGLVRNKQIQNAITSYYPIMRMISANQGLFDLLPIKSKLKIQIKNSSRVFFGSYPQRSANSKQPIEWITLYKDEKMAILLSKFCLDAQKFNSSKENYTVHWETSEIRKWLNSHFLNAAFNAEEQNSILEAQLRNPAGPSRDSRAGNQTVDRVFLLSCEEADAYLKDPALKGGFPTDYARMRGCELGSQTNETGWWLRTSGDGVCSAYTAYSGRKITYSDPTAAAYARLGQMSGDNSSNYGTLAYNIRGVRPAILVDLSD